MCGNDGIRLFVPKRDRSIRGLHRRQGQVRAESRRASSPITIPPRIRGRVARNARIRRGSRPHDRRERIDVKDGILRSRPPHRPRQLLQQRPHRGLFLRLDEINHPRRTLIEQDVGILFVTHSIEWGTFSQTLLFSFRMKNGLYHHRRASGVRRISL